MDVASSINAFQQVFIDFVRSLETEADETHLDFGGKLEARVGHAEISELLGKTDVPTNVRLKN